ncbi:MAG TPA: hypothetical protein VIL09_01730 [Microvirga sp.]|jgi:hypothetical protein
MRVAPLILAGAFGLMTSAAWAGPIPITAPDRMTGAAATLIHHKPGHQGGPPWARRQQQPAYERYDRPVRSVETCRTTTRTQVDPYTGDTVRRSVRVCD